MALAAAPAVAAFFGGDAAAAAARTELMAQICVARSARFTIGARGTPVGIDARLVAELAITPQITTGVLHATLGRRADRRRRRAPAGRAVPGGGRGAGGRIRGVIEVGPNFIARPYRGVSVQDAPGLDEAALREWLIGRRVYRRTEFVVARCGEEHAVVQVEHPVGEDVLATVSDLRVLARPDEVAFVVDPSVDTGNATQMARVARARVTVVQGRFEHVNFIVEPAPVRVRVLEVVPPEPPKLLEMARAVVGYDEDLPPVDLQFEPIDLRELAPAGRTMYPCRCSGLEGDFLDAGPEEMGDWTLVGCERSRQIHVALYGAEPADRIDFCPRVVAPPTGRR